MQTNHIITLVIRLAALLLLLYGIHNMFNVVSFWLQSDQFFVEMLWATLTPLVMFGLMWYFSPKLANWVTLGVPQQATARIDHFQLLRVVVIALSLFLLVNSVIQIGYLFFNSFVFKTSPEFTRQVDTVHMLKTSIATELTQILVAVFMLAKNTLVTRSLLKINAQKPATDSKQSDQTD